MAGKNDPSIYDDRTTIGSSDELDEYGVWVKSEPQDLSSALPDIEELPDINGDFNGDLDLPDFSDDSSPEAVSAASDGGADLEFEEVPENSELPMGLDPVSVDKDGFTEVSMNDFLDSETTLSAPKSIDFGDLDSNIDEVEPENLEPVSQAAAPGPAGTADLSTQLLMKIADELSSIKKELSSLKNELGVVRREVKSEGAESKGGGFFDEEDDEKIALTGDELDNILNTANFTEESGSGEALGDNDLALDMTVDNELNTGGDLSGGADILDESGEEAGSAKPADISFDEVDLSEINGDIQVEDDIKNLTDDFDISLDLSSTDISSAELPPEDFSAEDISFEDIPTEEILDFSAEPAELNTLRKEGAMPITPAPENTSYLEEDPLAADFNGTDQIDLSGAVIEEPDLSAHITENPVSEPAIDNISIDLEMEEPDSASFPPDKGGDSGDFVFETEETMEIPLNEEPVIDDQVPLGGDSPFGEEESLPDFPESAPLGGDSSFVEEPSFDIPAAEPTPAPGKGTESADAIPSNLKQELKTVLSYMDQLLESLPEDKIEEFAKSEYFDTYKKLFEELGLV
ncbi:MAG: hypothetical protein LBO65_04345 [Spirochaetaceae bacterium]|jgi:hypothetical protein|nr:hypothetical protein [Spirochaetaceae bacterium]